MVYRDAETAMAERVAAAEDEARAREERITPALRAALPHALRRDLEEQEAWLETNKPTNVDAWREREAAVARYSELLDEVIARAPRIAKRYNRLPRAFPPRIVGAHYVFPDIHDKRTLVIRERIHRLIEDHDPDARIYDRATTYCTPKDKPFVVDACFRAAGAAERLLLHKPLPYGQYAPGQDGYTFALSTLVRASVPTLRVTGQTVGDQLLTWLSIKRDAKVGDALFDDAFLVSGADRDAQRVLTEPVRSGVWALRDWVADLELRVESGVAHLSYRDRSANVDVTDNAIAVMVALRGLAPTVLLRRVTANR
mgnify:CR=1 FL=1